MQQIVEHCPRCEADVSNDLQRCATCGQILDFDSTIMQRTPPPYRPSVTPEEIERRLAAERTLR